MRSLVLFLTTLLFLLSSCADKYNVYKSKYQFRSADGKPDYTNLDYWAAHPLKWDPSDSVPEPLRSAATDKQVDVFFLHPTSYTKSKINKASNAPIDDEYINAKTDYSSILYQASVFNEQCLIYSPRYRQAHITNFFKKNKEEADAAFDLAYEDIKNSFEYYLRHWNNGRPIIIASHSQGSLLAERLLKDYFDLPANDTGITLKNKLVVAYILGWPVPKEYFGSLRVCDDSLQTGCICTWRTLRRWYRPDYLKKENGNSFVTNPLNWTSSTDYASREMNKGSVLLNFNKIYPHTTDAQISNGLLYVKKPRFPGSFFYFTRNYHIGDINLYYMNIRENVAKRIGMFWKK